MVQTEDAPVELRLLGGFELSVGATTIDMTPSAQRLLAFVALTPRGADRSFTAFQLWPEHDERRAKANLRSALWRLGKVPAQLVIATKSQLRLAPTVWVDVKHGMVDFATAGLLSIVQAMLPLQSLDSDLLPDWYDDWLTIERERFRQLHFAMLEEAARSQLEQGGCSAAVQLALAAVAIDPLRESGHRIVIEAHLAHGNRFEAERQFEYYRGLLRAQTGCEPTAGMTAVLDQHSVEPERATALLIAV